MQLYKSKVQTHFHTIWRLCDFLGQIRSAVQQHGEPPQADLELTGDSFVQEEFKCVANTQNFWRN